MIIFRRQAVFLVSVLIGIILGILTGAPHSLAQVYSLTPTGSFHTGTPGPAGLRQPVSTVVPTPVPEQALNLGVSWESPVAPRSSFDITLEMRDLEAASADWVLGDVSGTMAEGTLRRGQSETVAIDIEWSRWPLPYSPWWFYVFGRGDDGSMFAQVLEVGVSQPISVTLTPTASCGFARVVLRTETDVTLAFPDETFEIEFVNEGILNCGIVDWYLIADRLHPDGLSCSPDNGVLEAGYPGEEARDARIQCAIDWREIDPAPTADFFLVLFSFPRVNGTASAHLIHVRAMSESGE